MDNLFAPINTTISVRDYDFLTSTDFEQLIKAPDVKTIALILQNTAYDLTAEDLKDSARIEKALIKRLSEDYQFAFEETPVAEVVELFSLRYTYHNLKVLLKSKASQLDLKHLLIPIGRYSNAILEYLVTTMSTEHVPKIMQEEVLASWKEYEDYQDIRVLDIGMDLAYFKHLCLLVKGLNDKRFSSLVATIIDFYNVLVVRRSLSQEKPNSFIQQLISDEGSLETRAYIDMVQSGDYMGWFSQLNPNLNTAKIRQYEDKLRSNQLTTQELEYFQDIMIHELLSGGRFQSEGPLLLACYLYGREMEVKNLRLVLTGRINRLDETSITERMRPIYGG